AIERQALTLPSELPSSTTIISHVQSIFSSTRRISSRNGPIQLSELYVVVATEITGRAIFAPVRTTPPRKGECHADEYRDRAGHPPPLRQKLPPLVVTVKSTALSWPPGPTALRPPCDDERQPRGSDRDRPTL